MVKYSPTCKMETACGRYENVSLHDATPFRRAGDRRTLTSSARETPNTMKCTLAIACCSCGVAHRFQRPAPHQRPQGDAAPEDAKGRVHGSLAISTLSLLPAQCLVHVWLCFLVITDAVANASRLNRTSTSHDFHHGLADAACARNNRNKRPRKYMRLAMSTRGMCLCATRNIWSKRSIASATSEHQATSVDTSSDEEHEVNA